MRRSELLLKNNARLEPPHRATEKRKKVEGSFFQSTRRLIPERERETDDRKGVIESQANMKSFSFTIFFLTVHSYKLMPRPFFGKSSLGIQGQDSYQSGADAVKEQVPIKVAISNKVIGGLFSIKPLFKIASRNARANMVKQGLAINVDWEREIKYLEDNIDTLETMKRFVADP